MLKNGKTYVTLEGLQAGTITSEFEGEPLGKDALQLETILATQGKPHSYLEHTLHPCITSSKIKAPTEGCDGPGLGPVPLPWLQDSAERKAFFPLASIVGKVLLQSTNSMCSGGILQK